MVKSKVKVQLCFPTPFILVHIYEEYFCPISRFKFGGNMCSTRLSTTEGAESGTAVQNCMQEKGKQLLLLKQSFSISAIERLELHLPVLKQMAGP